MVTFAIDQSQCAKELQCIASIETDSQYKSLDSRFVKQFSPIKKYLREM